MAAAAVVRPRVICLIKLDVFFIALESSLGGEMDAWTIDDTQ